MQIKSAPQYDHVYFIGTVVANNDPNMQYRLRVSIPGIYDTYTVDQLPWAIPFAMNGLAMNTTASDCNVPDVGALVICGLQNGDPHFPYSSGVVVDGTTGIHAVFQTNYPTRYGRVDSYGNIFYVDTTSGEVQFTHKSGTSFTIDSSGNLTLNVVANITSSAQGWVHTGNFTLDGDLTVSQNVAVDQNVTVTGSTTTASLNVTG